MDSTKTLTDISHYDLFRILDFLKTSCEVQNGNESLYPVKYGDIFNFAATCKILRRIVWDWSREMYDRLEIDHLHVRTHKRITMKFLEIHKSLKGATEQKRDKYMDVYIKAMMSNSLLKTIKLSYNTQEYNKEHDIIFDEIVMGLQGKTKRIILDPMRIPTFKEITVDIADHQMSNLGLFRNISKLTITASFGMFDLVEFCINNPSLVTLEVNVHRFSDQGKLTQIVRHCPNLRQLKFLPHDNERDNAYVGLALLDRLQQLEIGKPPMPKEVQFLLPDDDVNMEESELTWLRPEQLEMDQEFRSKQPRMDSEYESLIEGDSNLEQPVPILQLLKALSEKKRSKLVRLCLQFDINDEMAHVIAKIKGLRMLECGFCDPKSIRHLVQHPTLNRLNILNRGHLVSVEIALLLRRQITVSSQDAKLFLSARGFLSICIRNNSYAEIYRSVNLEPLTKLGNLKVIKLPDAMIASLELTMHQFLELGVLIKGDACDISFDPQERELKMIYSGGSAHEELPAPLVRNLRSFALLSIFMPTSHLFHNLCTIHLGTMHEVYIDTPQTLFDTAQDTYLSRSVVEALVTLKGLRKISCGLQKLIYIQPLAQLKDLEYVHVLSEHHPTDEPFPRCLEPLLENCHKLRSFHIKVPVKGISEKFLEDLEYVVVKSRDLWEQNDLDICLCLKQPPDYRVTELNLNESQLKLLTRPFKLMKVTTKYVENDYVFD
ncbi:uncharacterized protein LOC108028079 [Drosophila biarmipes]|uniref:uncharacterized protein LOC108028079 n=1 Tax=Drosophila biarmipes TaxID=125945 RepID=UPI0007E63ECC|nr:uncharacterized protein LOC108028079 [Drosophila biarmipes]